MDGVRISKSEVPRDPASRRSSYLAPQKRNLRDHEAEDAEMAASLPTIKTKRLRTETKSM